VARRPTEMMHVVKGRRRANDDRVMMMYKLRRTALIPIALSRRRRGHRRLGYLGSGPRPVARGRTTVENMILRL